MKRAPLRLLALGVAWLPGSAMAHLVSTGLGPFYDGVGHFFISLGELLPLLALGLLAGLHGVRGARRTVVMLPLVWWASALVGAVAGMMLTDRVEWLLPAVLSLWLGVLVALDRQLPECLLTALIIAIGVLCGFVAGNGLAQQAHVGQLLLGSALAQFVVISLLAAGVVALTRSARAALGWQRLIVRIAGSWLAAAGLLSTGWALR